MKKMENGTSFDSSSDTLFRKGVENDVLKNLNNLIVLLNVNHPRVSSLLHISSSVFWLLFEKAFGYQPIDIIGSPKTAEDEAHNIQCVIDTLSLDILGVSLSHITGEDILARKPLPIYHLLEIINEFIKASELQNSRSSISVPVPASASSAVSHSNVSHKEHFCPVCEYGLTKLVKTTPVLGSDSSQTCHSCSLRISQQDKENSSVDFVESRKSVSQGSTSRIPSSNSEPQPEVLNNNSSVIESAVSTRKSLSKKLSFNDKLAQRLAQNLVRLNREPDSFFTAQEVPLPESKTVNEVYKSVFQRNNRKRLPTPEKETSVLLPRYLKRRRTCTKTQSFSCKKQKVQPLVKDKSSSEGILEEIKSDVPAAHFSREGLNVLGLDHKRQVNLLSSRLSSLKNKISASERMLHDNISKQVQMAELEQKDFESQERLRDVKSLRNEYLRARGAIRNNDIQRARLKRYYDQYYIQHHQKLSSRKAKEELIVRNLYKTRLAQQKQRIIDLSKDLRDQEKEEAERLGNRMASAKNLFLGKTERLKKHAEEEKLQKQTRNKAQQEVLEQTRRAILKQIENEVKEIQGNLERQDDFHFVESDAERLVKRWTRPT